MTIYDQGWSYDLRHGDSIRVAQFIRGYSHAVREATCLKARICRKLARNSTPGSSRHGGSYLLSSSIPAPRFPKRGEPVLSLRLTLSWLAVILIATGLGAWWLLGRQSYEDLGIYLAAVSHWADGNELYAFKNHNGGGFTYPPLFAVLLLPVAATKLSVSSVGPWWGLAALVAAVATTYRMSRAVSDEIAPERPAREGYSSGPTGWSVFPLALAALLLAQATRDFLYFGQLSPFVSALALWVGGSASNATRIGIGAALKLTPGAMWGVWFMLRQWSTLKVSLAVFLATTAAVGMATPRSTGQYFSELIFQTSRVGDLASLGNNSLLGLLQRHQVPGATLWWGAAGCLFLLCVRNHRTTAISPFVVLSLGYFAALLFAPVTWTHHAAMLAPALVCLGRLQQTTARRLILLGVTVPWFLPTYTIAKAMGDYGWAMADIRPASLIVIIAVTLTTCAASNCPSQTHQPAT